MLLLTNKIPAWVCFYEQKRFKLFHHCSYKKIYKICISIIILSQVVATNNLIILDKKLQSTRRDNEISMRQASLLTVVTKHKKSLFKMSYELCKRIRRMLKRNRTNCCTNKDTYNKLEDRVMCMNAGWLFVERCNVIFRQGIILEETDTYSENPATIELQILALAIKTGNTIPDIDLEIQEYTKRPRRNAVFEIKSEERTGLPMVLKHHLQFKHIQNYGII